MKFRKKGRAFAVLSLTVLLLCGCGEEKKGDDYLREGKYEEAVAVYEGLLTDKTSDKAREKNQRMYSRLGEAYCYMEDYEKSRECFDQVISLAGEEEVQKEIYLYRGLCFEKLSQYKEAAGDYEAYLSQLAKEKEDGKKELSEEEAAIQVFAYNELGLCYLKQGEEEKALEAIDQGLLLEPEKEKKRSLMRNRIIILEYLARFEEACAECGVYLEEYPEDEEMVREYEFLKTRI